MKRKMKTKAEIKTKIETMTRVADNYRAEAYDCLEAHSLDKYEEKMKLAHMTEFAISRLNWVIE